MRYKAHVLLNIRRDMMQFLNGYRDGDPMEFLTTFHVDASSATGAAEEVFALGNAPWQPLDAEGNGWPAARSLSVGDVVIVIGPDGGSNVLACQSVGWQEVGVRLM